ncbi:MAG: hypothetical protein WDO13_00645 [Verrucomicrobiota bacterium]
MTSSRPLSLHHRSRRDAWRRSSALVITLAIVAVLTVLLLAFLSRAGMERQIAGASAAENKADQIAKAGLDIIVTDFRQEIAAGSTVTANTTGNPGWPGIYLPASANTSVPARLLTGSSPTSETNNFNLVRRSMTVAEFASVTGAVPLSSYYSQYGGAFPTNNLASSPNANTAANPSANGRSISPTRWNKPQLLNDTTHFIPPDWVLVTRNGPEAFTAWDATVADASPANTNYVIGRYAYTVYDEGGLLDVNVVGRLSAIPTPPIGKTVVSAMADLTQLTNSAPNWTGSACIPAQSAVDKLVQWRDASTSATAYNAANPSDTTTYFGYVTGSTNSFTLVQPGNQAFLTRQDLINSITSTAPGSLGAAGFTTNALPFLATFTRQVNAPSFYPALTNFNPAAVNNATVVDASSRPKTGVGTSGGLFSIPGYDTADQASSAIAVRAAAITLDNQNYSGAADMLNPALADVRFPLAGTLPDGTTVTKGEPLLRKRFALSRLALLTASNATVSSSATPTDQNDLIYRYFGLTRSTATFTTPGGTYVSPWIYNHGGPTGEILTLQELQAAIANGTIAPRDPDFFELLQAAIAAGSLGRDAANPSSVGDSGYGVIGTGDTTAPSPTPAPSQTDESVTYHILQIGANIIDQANPRYDPISISIGGSAPVTVYGQEDLPCVNKIIPFICTDSPTTGTQSMSGWYLFELWNPYQVPNSSSNNPQLRLTGNPPNGTASSAFLNIKVNNAPAQYLSYPATDFTAAGSGTNYIQFTPTANSTFAVPAVLAQGNTSGMTSPVARNVQSAGDVLNDGVSHTWAGIYAGNISNPAFATNGPCESWEISPGTTQANQEGTGSTKNFVAGFATFALQVLTSNGAWQTYNLCRNLYSTKNSTGSAVLNTPPGGGYLYSKLDPRTDRWSFSMDENFAVNGSSTKIGITWLWAPKTHSGGYNPKLVGYYWGPQMTSGFNQPGTQTGPTPGGNYFSLNQNNDQTTYSYIDPDGVVRRADEMYSTVGSSDAASYGVAMNLTASNGVYPSRPFLLHRPFQSVAELGYAFRDVAWKSLDFFTSRSGDSALLDVFSAYEEPPVVAGKVDVNTRNVPVLAALLNGACIDELDSGNGAPTQLSPAEALGFANKLVSVSSSLPLHNKSDLVNRVMAGLTTDATSATPNTGDGWGGNFSAAGLPQAQKASIKMNREAPIRSLSEATASRTWNFLIDIIAQSGRYTASSASFADFTTDGEKRYWLHVAIDRYTGKIVDEQLEPVYE